MSFNILRKAYIRNSTACRYATGAGYSVEWLENDNFEGYGEYSGLTTRLVWDRNYFAATTSGVCYIGPTTDQAPFDGGVYNLVRTVFRVEPISDLLTPATGKLQFQTSDDPVYDDTKVVEFSITADNAYNEYTIDMTLVKEWVGNITRIRLYPTIDGYPGTIVHFKSIKVFPSIGGAAHECSVGAGGSCRGGYVADGIDIVEGVNDKLIIDINGYGGQGVTITPVRGALLKDIGRDVEDKLSTIAIGGYAGNRVDVEYGRMTITADDTREADSTVVVEDTAAARTLGFYDSSGNAISTSTPGEGASDHYVPAGTIQLSKAEIAKMYLSDPGTDPTGLRLNPRQYAVQAGRHDYAVTYKERKLDFIGKTVIDINNPVSNNGVIKRVAYTGDGTPETEFRFFRPKADGTITHFASVDMGISVSQNDKDFEAAASVRVRKGDLIGAYNGRVDQGKNIEKPNNSYFLYDGDLTEGATAGPLSIEGRGETGLRLFARGNDLASEAVLDIEFEQRELIEEVVVFAEEESRTEEVNLSRAQCGGVNGGPQIEAETGYDKYGGKAAGMTDLGALTDGVKFDTPDASAFHPTWEDSYYEPADLYEQTFFSVTLDFARGVPVLFDINRVVVYFKYADNVKYFSVQYPWTTNDTDTDRFFGPVGDKYSEVYLHDRLLTPDTHTLYDNPNQPVGDNYIDSYKRLEYSQIDLRFEAVRTRTIKYFAKNFYYEDDVTKETYSAFAVAPGPYILEMEVFAESAPVASIADNFYFESSVDGEDYVRHTNVQDDGETSASYLIGYPVKYLRAHIAPQGELRLDGFSSTLSSAQEKIITNEGENFVGLNAAKNDHTSYETITVVNAETETFNYFVNISAQKGLVDRCILWNKMGSAAEMATSEIGPSPAISKRDAYYPREYNFAHGAPAYVADPFWMLNTNAQAYITYDHGATWESRGNILTDYNVSTTLTSTNADKLHYPYVYILVDLGDNYRLDNLEVRYPDGSTTFSIMYSGLDVSDPADLNLVEDFYGTLDDVRWVRLRAFSQLPSQANPPAVSYLIGSIDARSPRNRGKVTWVSASYLTNYKLNEYWQTGIDGITNWYAVNLEDYYNITNIILGPGSDYFNPTYVSDIDLIEPGGQGSAFTANSKSNSNIAYSRRETDDPSDVIWGSLGDAPSGRDRWIIIRRKDDIRDEVIVHIDDNVQENKPCFGSSRWWAADLGTVEKDTSNPGESTHSMSVIYAAGQGPAEEEIELTQSLGIDTILAPRDQLYVWFYVSDVSQLDLTTGHIAIGRNTEEDHGGKDPLNGVEKDSGSYYQWDLADLSGIITTGWNILYLPFTENFKNGRPFFARDDITSMSGSTLTNKSRFRWFRINFSGVEGNSEFKVGVADLQIVRADFVPAKYGDGYYLSGDEYIRFPLHNFNVLEGTIEFYLNPDWDKFHWCNTCADPRDHMIFRIFNSDQYVIGAFMSSEGLVFYISDGEVNYSLTDSKGEPLFTGQNTHIAFVWQLMGDDFGPALAIYIDNKLSTMLEVLSLQYANFKPNPNATLLFGGKGHDGILESPRCSSVDGVIDNLKVHNYAIRDFSASMTSEGVQYVRPGDELIEVSVDGTNFYGSEERGDALPLLVQNVAPGESFEVRVRTKEGLTEFPSRGQERNGYIEIMRARPG